MSTSVLKALPGKLDIKRHSPSILYFLYLLAAEEEAEDSVVSAEKKAEEKKDSTGKPVKKGECSSRIL